MGEMKTLWRGKPLEEYSKEELIEIINELGAMQNRDREQHKKDLDMAFLFARK